MGSEHWDDNGCCTRCGTKGNGYQACGNCTGLSRHGLAMQQQGAQQAAQVQHAYQQLEYLGKVGAPVVYEENVALLASVEMLKKDLAASEKERERLAARNMELCDELDIARTCIDCGSAAKERDIIRRELENLKREHASELGDARGLLSQVEQHRDELYDRERFLQRELDRERAKRKRGL